MAGDGATCQWLRPMTADDGYAPPGYDASVSQANVPNRTSRRWVTAVNMGSRGRRGVCSVFHQQTHTAQPAVRWEPGLTVDRVHG